MSGLVFLDLETTGLVYGSHHTITEIGMVLPDGKELAFWVALTPEELAAADPIALKINQYYSRAYGDRPGYRTIDIDNRHYWAKHLAVVTEGCVFAGNNVAFDVQWLALWMRQNGACPVWDYHVCDVPTYAAGVLNERRRSLLAENKRGVKASYPHIDPPFKSKMISDALGVKEPEGAEAHSAIADARWSQSIWEALDHNG